MAKLLQATIDTVAEVGYARTSVNEVCRRAGVSTGGLFRHFATREDLLVAAMGEVARRHLDEARSQLDGVSFDDERGIETAVRRLRDITRGPTNAVYYELLIACRTDQGLADKLRPTLLAYYLQVLQLGAELFGIEEDPDRLFESFLFGILTIIEGETVGRAFGRDPDLEERRLAWLVQVAEATIPRLKRRADVGADVSVSDIDP